MKRAVALLRKGQVLVQGYSKTTAGMWVGMGPVYVVQEDRAAELGASVRDALSGSTEGVPHPSPAEWKKIQAPMLGAAGVKSWTTLAKGAKSVGLECDGVTVKMVPSSNYENKGGTSLPEKTIGCELASSELGGALVMAFNACN
jgi:hypothetical protein